MTIIFSNRKALAKIAQLEDAIGRLDSLISELDGFDLSEMHGLIEDARGEA